MWQQAHDVLDLVRLVHGADLGVGFLCCQTDRFERELGRGCRRVEADLEHHRVVRQAPAVSDLAGIGEVGTATSGDAQ